MCRDLLIVRREKCVSMHACLYVQVLCACVLHVVGSFYREVILTCRVCALLRGIQVSHPCSDVKTMNLTADLSAPTQRQMSHMHFSAWVKVDDGDSNGI